MSPTVERTSKSLADQIAEAIAADQIQLPPLPELATRLRETLARDNVGTKEIAALIQNEPALVASLLRIANSAAFGGLRQVTDLNQALARLGLDQVGSIVSTLLMKGNFASPDPQKLELLSKMWDHAVVSGFAARRLAQRTAGNAEQAFMAGLLHDTGQLLVLKSVDFLESKRQLGIQVTRGVYEELMEALHAELGYMTLKSWNLPEPICDVVRRHEAPLDDASDALLVAVQAGDRIATKLGFGPRPDPELSLLQEPAIEALGLTDMQLATLMVDLEDELCEVRRLFA